MLYSRWFCMVSRFENKSRISLLHYYIFCTGLPYKGLGKLGTQLNLNTDTVGEIFVPIPTVEEIEIIVNYLDEKTAQIDSLINNKLRLIELLKEERTAIINQAVTRGINPHAKLKPSSIAWLGDIPEHWEVKKLKFVSEINSTTLAEKQDDSFEIKYIDIGSVSEGQIIQTADYLFSDAPSRARRIVKGGDTVVSTVRTYLRAVAFIENDVENLICSTGFAVIRPDKDFIGKFLFFICFSAIFIEKVVALSKGVSYPAIDSEDIKNIEVWLPPIEEQKQIVEFIETATEKIDATIDKIEKEIGFLREYRTALISEVVTGKIKVTDNL